MTDEDRDTAAPTEDEPTPVESPAVEAEHPPGPEAEPEPVADVIRVTDPDPEPEPTPELQPAPFPDPIDEDVSVLEPEPEVVTELEPLAVTAFATPPADDAEPDDVDAESADESEPVPAADTDAIAVAESDAGDGDVLDAEATPAAEAAPPAPPVDEKKHWYVVKVQSGREESIKAAVERRMRIEGLEHFVGQIVIPTEKVTVIKKVTERKKASNGEYVKVTKEKRVVKEQKKFPGYLMAFVEYNNEVLSLFRETSGVGDFVGGTLTRPPTPMTDREVAAMLSGMGDDEGDPDKLVAPTLKFGKGDRVKVRDGIFAGMDGEVKEIIDPKDAKETTRVKVELMIWGRPTSVDLEHWQVDPV